MRKRKTIFFLSLNINKKIFFYSILHLQNPLISFKNSYGSLNYYSGHSKRPKHFLYRHKYKIITHEIILQLKIWSFHLLWFLDSYILHILWTNIHTIQTLDTGHINQHHHHHHWRNNNSGHFCPFIFAYYYCNMLLWLFFVFLLFIKQIYIKIWLIHSNFIHFPYFSHIHTHTLSNSVE